MEEQKHTPGPWKMDEDGCFISQEGDVLKMVGQVRGWGWLSKKYGDEKAYEIQKANGALMARAPELLEQVSSLTKERQEMVEALRGIMESCDPENTSHETIWRIAYSAMNKKP